MHAPDGVLVKQIKSWFHVQSLDDAKLMQNAQPVGLKTDWHPRPILQPLDNVPMRSARIAEAGIMKPDSEAHPMPQSLGDLNVEIAACFDWLDQPPDDMP
jgi:hypothetical protein